MSNDKKQQQQFASSDISDIKDAARKLIAVVEELELNRNSAISLNRFVDSAAETLKELLAVIDYQASLNVEQMHERNRTASNVAAIKKAVDLLYERF